MQTLGSLCLVSSGLRPTYLFRLLMLFVPFIRIYLSRDYDYVPSREFSQSISEPEGWEVLGTPMLRTCWNQPKTRHEPGDKGYACLWTDAFLPTPLRIPVL